jgi:hypothetical protein
MQQQVTSFTSQSSSTYQNLRLHEWIDQGRASGRIRNVNTVLLAYCMEEREAMAWIADIVQGKTTEDTALIFMERALHAQTQH